MALRNKDNESSKSKEAIVIKPLNNQIVRIPIIGTAPLCLHRFSKKAELMAGMEAGSTAKNKKKREPKDFERDYREAMYVSTDGWNGFNAASIRNAMISACRVAGFAMTKAKLTVFVEADGFDNEGTPLVKITKGEPEMYVAPVRNATGVIDMRARPMWKPGWEAILVIRFDADQFTKTDVVNLIYRVGQQGGIGEGRPDSKNSGGLGFGLFDIKSEGN